MFHTLKEKCPKLIQFQVGQQGHSGNPQPHGDQQPTDDGQFNIIQKYKGQRTNGKWKNKKNMVTNNNDGEKRLLHLKMSHGD